MVEADVVVGGIRVNLLDTAGIRDTDDLVESIGVQISKAAAVGADVVMMVVSASEGWTEEDNKVFQDIWGDHVNDEAGVRSSRNGSHGFSKFGGSPSVLVINKVDTASPTSVLLPDDISKAFSAIVPTCAPQSMGINNLEAALLKLVGVGELTSGGRQWAANQRQAEQLLRASEALARVKMSAEEDFPIDMWTVDLKEAAIALGQISGDDVTEEVLSSIFSRFCIGK